MTCTDLRLRIPFSKYIEATLLSVSLEGTRVVTPDGLKDLQYQKVVEEDGTAKLDDRFQTRYFYNYKTNTTKGQTINLNKKEGGGGGQLSSSVQASSRNKEEKMNKEVTNLQRKTGIKEEKKKERNTAQDNISSTVESSESNTGDLSQAVELNFDVKSLQEKSGEKQTTFEAEYVDEKEQDNIQPEEKTKDYTKNKRLDASLLQLHPYAVFR